jgi:uncharacterized delta-60 repeat protein
MRIIAITGLSAIAIAAFLSQARAMEPPEPRISSPSPGVVNIALELAARMGGVAIQNDGTIVVAATTISGGSHRGILIRLTPNGVLADHGILQIGDVIMNVGDVTVTSEGEIVVVGDAYRPESAGNQQVRADFLVARFLPDGRPDTSFGRGGWTLTDVGQRDDHDIAKSVVVQPDGRILVTGQSNVPYWLIMRAYSFATVRYNVDGSLDNSFGDGGRVITRMGVSREDDGCAVLILPGGKIVVAGAADSSSGRPDFALARYLPNGQLDRSFGRSGKSGPFGLGLASYAYSAALDAHQRVVVGGFVTLSEDHLVSQAPVLVRYNIDGSLDQSFGNGGVVVLQAGGYLGEIEAVAVQPDAKIIGLGLLRGGKCTGTDGSCIAAIRLNDNGSLDKTFADDGVYILPFRPARRPFRLGVGNLAIQRDGKLVLAGQRDQSIMFVRLNSDGTPDAMFGAAGTR